tara:strand:+ start:5264 stop:5605 length:342 start_codon:yes stop_codon:yes gene_type:complete
MSGKKIYSYGMEGKAIVFVDDDKRHADLRIRLRHDGLTQTEFFQSMITGYLNNDERIIEYITSVKYELAKQGKRRIMKSKKMLDKGKELLKDYSFSDEERDELFDMIAEELIE